MNEPQIWTLIGVFGAALFSMIGLVSSLFLRVLRAELHGVRSELLGEIRRVEGVLTARMDHLDRDVSSIARRVFGDPPAA